MKPINCMRQTAFIKLIQAVHLTLHEVVIECEHNNGVYNCAYHFICLNIFQYFV
jgi:hypothetical protein